MASKFSCATILTTALFLAGCSTSVQVPSTQKKVRSFDMTGCVALTNTELDRLQKAYDSAGADHDTLIEFIEKIDAKLADGINIPPEGGQHNQWYQCERCQMHLETIDSTHHKCPTCGEIYSGWPYDNVLYNHQHHDNGWIIRDAAYCYAITGDEKYSKAATELLEGYSQLYTTLPRIVNYTKDRPALEKDGSPAIRGGYISNQTLNESMLMVDMASGLDILRLTGAVSDTQLKKINTGLIRPMIDSICGLKSGKSNWQTWHNAAMVYASAVLNDKSLLDMALNQPGNGFYDQMKISVLGDGMWYENSWGYHYYTLQAMTHIAEGCRRLGVDIYKSAELKSMYMAVLDYIMPDGTLPMFGDATAGGSYSSPVSNEAAYEVYKDKNLASILTTEPTFYSIIHGRDTAKIAPRAETKSVIKPDAGHAILRSSAGDNEFATVFVFGPYGGFHGHFDKLSFVYGDNKNTLAIDHGRAKSQAYRLPIHRQWYKSTFSHNTIMLDGEDQEGITGKILQTSLGDKESFSAASATAPGIFADKADFTRFILSYKDYLVVIDQIESLDGQSHRADWLLHSSAREAVCELPQSDNTLGLPESPGTAYLKNIKFFDMTADGLTYSFVDDSSKALNVALDIAGAEKMSFITADGPFGSVVERVAVSELACQGKDIVIAAAITKNNELPKPVINKTADSLSVTINFAENEKCVIKFDGGKISGGFTIDGIK